MRQKQPSMFIMVLNYYHKVLAPKARIFLNTHYILCIKMKHVVNRDKFNPHAFSHPQPRHFFSPARIFSAETGSSLILMPIAL